MEIGPWSASDADVLLNIYARIFGDPAATVRRASWAWQYEQNPASPGRPIIWVARDGERAVGQLGTMPVALAWNGADVRASWGVDYFVAPDREGLGYSIELIKTWMRSVDVALALGLAPASYLICLRLGFRDLGLVPYFEAVLDPAAVARRRWGAVAGAGAWPLRAMSRLARLRRPRGREVDVVPAGDIGAAYDALWDAAGRGYVACVRRDAAYVHWKYRATPHKTYRLVEARRKQQLTGFAVTRQENYRGLEIGWIVDLFTARDDQDSRDALLFDVMAAFDRAGVARVQAFASNTELAAALRRHGFFSRPSRSHLCARPNGATDLPCAQPGGWHIMFGDGDSDR